MIIDEATQHDEQVAHAEELMDQENFTAAAKEASKVLEELEKHVATVAQAALVKGRAMTTHVLNEMSEKGELPPKETFETIWKSYELSKKLNPDCDVTQDEMTKVSHLLRELPPPRIGRPVDFDVVVVGAGASGIGVSSMLTQTFGVDTNRVLVVERGSAVGETFLKWPKEMRFISPSFNQQGWTQSFDLNSVVANTSPAYSLHSEHPSGQEYASYLQAIAKLQKLNVQLETEVTKITPAFKPGELPLFTIELENVSKPPEGVEETKEEKLTLDDPPSRFDDENFDELMGEMKGTLNLNNSKSGKKETISARYIIWAAGEFQYPPQPEKSCECEEEEEKKEIEAPSEDNDDDDEGIVGMEHCQHNSTVRCWADMPGDSYVLIGGYESGCDAAYNLAKAGKKVSVLASTPCWSVKTADPSAELAPYTAARMREVLAPEYPHKPKLFAPLRVTRVDKTDDGMYLVSAEWKAKERKAHAPLREFVTNIPDQPLGAAGTTLTLRTPNPPILCTGFEGSVKARASHLFEFATNKEEIPKAPTHKPGEEDHGHSHAHHDHHAPKKGGCLEGAPLLTEHDESTKVPGVFLCGPMVSHGTLSFCFVYKFRQRFAIVCQKICEGLAIDTRAAIADCKKNHMYLKDFSCCGDTCGDVC